MAERDDTFVRVQVKRASPRSDRPRGYQIAKPGRNRASSTAKDPDQYLVWLPRERQFVELPGDFLKGRSSRSLPIDALQHLKDPTQ